MKQQPLNKDTQDWLSRSKSYMPDGVSLMTGCNFCTLNRLKKHYGDKLLRIGNDFYIPVKEGEDWDEENSIDHKGVRHKWICWLMSVPDHCVC